MTDSDIEPDGTFEFTVSKAMWHSGALPDAGLGYVAIYVLLQVILLPTRWLRKALSCQPNRFENASQMWGHRGNPWVVRRPPWSSIRLVYGFESSRRSVFGSGFWEVAGRGREVT
jgi:hypothetical protein